LEKRYESTTGLLQSTLANIEELQRTPPPSVSLFLFIHTYIHMSMLFVILTLFNCLLWI